MHGLAIKILRLMQRPFGWAFWLLEGWIAKVEDRVANTRGAAR
jgi:hypothetical protein